MKKWLVFWVKGGRTGSLPLTDENLDGMHVNFFLSLIQIDISGTQHWEVVCPRKRTDAKKRREAYGAKYGKAALKNVRYGDQHARHTPKGAGRT